MALHANLLSGCAGCHVFCVGHITGPGVPGHQALPSAGPSVLRSISKHVTVAPTPTPNARSALPATHRTGARGSMTFVVHSPVSTR